MPVEVRWIPGHKGIPGNERADQLARSALWDLPPSPTASTQAAVKRQAEATRQKLVDDWWASHAPEQYRLLGLLCKRRKPPELQLPRRLLHKLLAARTGHSDFVAYHQWFNHQEAILTCSCGREKSPTHFLRCRETETEYRHS